MSQDNRARLKQWLASGEARLQPLTFPQRELWEASPVPAADVSNNICAILKMRAPVTPAIFETAVQKVVDRQEVLRLSFLPGKDGPVQLIRKTSKSVMEFHELPASQAHPEAIEELETGIFRKPFDLVRGPLYRAEVFRRAADDLFMVFSIHHAIADGWTLGVFVQDLFTAYVESKGGSQTALPSVPLSYAEWGAAERAFWQPAELARRATFWKSHLAGTRRLWSPPTDPTAATGKRERWAMNVPAELGRAVRERARRDGATLFSMLLTAFQITLSKWTGADDIVVGTPVANRNKQAVRETMGSFSGIVPLRGHVDRARSFSDSLRAVHDATVESFANAMPFAELVKVLGEPTLPGRNPVFDVRFALQNHPVPDISLPGLSLKLRMRSTGTARFDLGCEINEEGDGLEVAWLFRLDMFSLEEIQDLGRMYAAVLKGVCQSPEILTSALMSNLR